MERRNIAVTEEAYLALRAFASEHKLKTRDLASAVIIKYLEDAQAKLNQNQDKGE